MGRRVRRRRHRQASISAMPSRAENIDITNEVSAMLLYEAPSGIAIFSFDGAYINNAVEDFWADTPQLILESFLKYDSVSTPIDLVSKTIDENLTKKLTMLCGSGKKLVVGSAQHKEIIEDNLGIPCLCVDVPDCEEIRTLKNHFGTLLPEKKSKTSKRNFDVEELTFFLHQHDFDIKPWMVSESIADLACQLIDVELCELEHLKFLRILLKDFIVKSGIDTKNWRLCQFVTVPKMICRPGSSYRIYPPDQIFSRDEYRKIEANASRYKASFSKIDALSFYEDVVSLYSKNCLLLHKLDCLVEEATGDNNEAPSMLLYEAPTGIAIFSFDGTYLDNSMKNFWADSRQLYLEEFIKCEKVANVAIDDNLSERLTRLCGSEKKLVVGSAQHKEIIEEKLRITCLCVDFPDCEVIASPKNHLGTLLHQGKLKTSKRDFNVEELTYFLHQHDIDIKPEMVSASIADLACQLIDGELCEMEHLMFLRILLQDFIVKSGIDTKNWRLSQFATVPKMICCPRSSDQIPPDQIFSHDEYRKIEANASRYKSSFSKIDALSVYEDVVSLETNNCLLLDKLDCLVQEAKWDINEAPSMLLYEAPTGIAIFSFGGTYLDNSIKDFLADSRQLCLEEFIKFEKVANVAIDDNLAERLTRLCGSEKKLVVGSAQHKEIIEDNLGITCLCVDVPDCEVIPSLKNHLGTLLRVGKSKMSKRDFDVEELTYFLHQHDFDIKPEMVSESIADLACQLIDVELCEMEHLKFLRILLQDFIVKSGIDTKNWRLCHFATVPKMICCPRSSYQIYPPDQIFSRDEYRKIEANASRYKTSFSKIDALSVYEDVVSLYTKNCSLLHKLDYLVEEAAGHINESPSMLLYEAPSGIAIFSFVGTYLDNSMKDFWADSRQLCLEEFIKCEKVANVAIDDNLAERLTRLCGSEKKLVVGSAQHKEIIKEKLRIACLCVDFPDCEVIASPMNHLGTLLHKGKLKSSKRDFDVEELTYFLRQLDFYIKPEMVSESIAELTRLLIDVELCEMEHLKFLRILLKDFIAKSGIDTKTWSLCQFATVLKMICCPRLSCQMWPPDKIFSRDEYQKIEADASRYKASFSKINVLFVYEDAVSLCTKSLVLLHDLGCLVEEDTDVQEKRTESVENNQAGDTGNKDPCATSEIKTASTSDPASCKITNSGQLKDDDANYVNGRGVAQISEIIIVDDDKKAETASTPDPAPSKIPNSKQLKAVDEKDKAKIDSGEKPQSGRLIDLIRDEMAKGSGVSEISEITVDEDEKPTTASTPDPAPRQLKGVDEKDKAKVDSGEKDMAKIDLINLTGSDSSVVKMPPYEVDRRSKSMKLLCMQFICCQTVR